MTKYEGPCNRCGIRVERKLRPGKEPLCLECAIRKTVEHNKGYADGTNPLLEQSRQAGIEAARQIRERSGPAYERWVGSMQRHLDTLNTTTDA